MTKTIMLIHGAWLNAQSWENWKVYYEKKGFRVVAPNWPFDDRSPAELRANPHPQLAKTGVKAIVDHFERLIRVLPEEPILIGHSAGAVWVQQLLDRGCGVAGVSIDPAPTTGVPLGPHAIVSAAPALFAWNGWNRSLQMTRKFFATRFAQTIPTRQEADELYERYVVPTAGKVYWDGVVTSVGKIRWDNPNRAPLLLVGGGLDLIADATMTKAIYEHQKRAPSKTELRIFPDRSHWTCMDPGWEQVADLALEWSLANMRNTPGLTFPVRA